MRTALGLDIGSHTIKLIELSIDGNKYSLNAAGSIPTPPGALTTDIKSDSDAIVVALKRLFKDTGAKSHEVNVCFCLY